MIIISIILAIIFNKSVKKSILQEKEFSGMGWGIANGLFGGLIWVLIAHNSINKEIAKIKDKEYRQYVEFQMKDFIKAFAIGFCINIVAIVIISTLQ